MKPLLEVKDLEISFFHGKEQTRCTDHVMGVQPPVASLGNILNGAESITILTGKPWLWLPAGILIILLVLCINFVGDALRDAIDPRNS